MGDFSWNEEAYDRAKRRKSFTFDEKTYQQAKARKETRQAKTDFPSLSESILSQDKYASITPEAVLQKVVSNEHNKYIQWEEEQKKWLEYDIPGATEKVAKYESALKDAYEIGTKRSHLETEREHIQGLLANEVGPESETKKDRDRILDIENELADIFRQESEIGALYGIEGDFDRERIQNEIDRLRKDIVYATTKQTGKRLADEALSAPNFETDNNYGKNNLAGVPFVKAYLSNFHSDLTLNNPITDPKHEIYGGGTIINSGHDFYEAMTEEEKKILGYYIKNDVSKAEDYINAITETVGTRVASEYATAADDWYDKLLFSLAAGADQFKSGIKGLGNAISGSENYVPTTPKQQGSSLIRQDIANSEGLGNKVLGVAYDLGSTTANMMPSVLVGLINPTAGAVTLGASAGGNAYNEMINLGYGANQARAYGAMIGASETLLERALGGIGAFGGGGKISAKMLSKIDNAFFRAAIKLGDEMLSEFTEESLQTIIEPWLRSVFNGEDFEAPNIDEILYSGLLGALSAGMFNGGSFAANAVVNNLEQSAADTALGSEVLKSTDHAANVQKLIDAAKNTDNKRLTRTANKVEKSYSEEKGFDTSEKNIGKLARLSEEQRVKAMVTATSADGIKSQTIAKLTESGMKNREAERAFELITRDAAKEQISTELADLMRANMTIRPIYEEVAEYMSEEAVLKRVADAQLSSPVTEVLNRIVDQRLKDAGIEVTEDIREIDNIDSVVNVDEYGKYILKRESGETYTYDPRSDKLPNVDYNTAQKVAFATTFRANGANAYVKLAPDNANAAYKQDFARIYDKGMHGQEFTPIESSISEETQRAIYNAGKLDLQSAAEESNREYEKAKKKETAFVKKQMGFKSDRVTLSEAAVAKIKSVSNKGISDQYKAAVKVIDGLAKMLQVNINIVASETDPYGKHIGANGQYNRATNTFTFDILSGMDNVADISYSAMIKTAGHELTHFIQNWSPSKYLTLKNTTLNFLKDEKGADWITEELRKIQSDNEAIGKTLTLEGAKDELVADAFEDVLPNIDFAETVLRTDKTLFDKIHSWVKKHANDFKKNLGIAVKDVGAISDAAKIMLKAGERAQALYNEWADAFTAALENSTSGQTASKKPNGEIKNSARKYSYADIISKPDMEIATLPKLSEAEKTKYLNDTNLFAKDMRMIAATAKNEKNTPTKTYLYCKDLKTDVLITKDSFKHGAARMDATYITVCKNIATVLNNSIVVNELTTRDTTDGGYVLLGMVETEDSYVIVRSIVNKRTWKLEQFQELDAIKKKSIKKEDVGLKPPNYIRKNGFGTSSFISISDFLVFVNTQNLANSVFSSDVVDKIGGKRGYDENVTPNLKYSARRRNKDAYIARKKATVKIAKAFVNSLPNSSNKAKLKVLVTNYAKQVETYAREQRAYIEATTNGNDEIAAVAYCGMTLAELAIDQIETDVDFASMHSEISAREKLREQYIREGEMEEEIRAFEADLTAAEREVRESKRVADQFAEREKKANYRAKQIELRNQRDRNTSMLLKEKTRINSALEKPSETASVPNDAKELANQVIRLVDALNAFNGTAALTRPSAELIDLIMKMSDGAERLANGSKSKSLAQRVNSIDSMMLNARYSVDQVKAQLSALEKQYKKLSPDYERKDGESAPSAAASIIYDKSLHDGLKVLVEYFDEPNIVFESGMFFVKEGLKIVRAMNHQILKANETYIKGKNVDVLKLRDRLYSDAQLASPFLNKFLGNGLFSNLLMPKTMLHVVFGATANADTFYDLYDDGQTRYIRYMNGAREMFLPIEKELTNEKFKSNKLTLKTGLKYTDGTEVLLNYDLAISFIKIVEDADNLRHAVWGGLQIPDIKPYNKGDKVTAYNSTHLVEHAQLESAPKAMSDEDIAKKLQDAASKGTELTSEDYVDMYAQQIAWNNRANLAVEIEAKYKAAAAMLKKQMSETEIGKQALKALSIISSYYDTYARKHLNEATMEMYGFEKTLQEGKSYYPISIRKSEQYKNENEFVVRDYSLENWGNMKHRQNSKKGIELFGAFTELEGYMESTAKYYAWTNVNKNVNKILNTQIADDDGTPTTLMRKVNRLHGSYDPKATGIKSVKNWFMTGFTKYMQDLENAIVGIDTSDSKWLSAFHGHFVTSALVLNFSTPLVQYSALPLVASDSGYLNYFKSTFKKPPILNEARLKHIAKYSEVYKYRSSGLINVDVAAARKNKNLLGKALTSKALAWTESADAQVLGHQYYALLEQVKSKHKGISEEEAARMAGKMLDQTIYDFQANYTVLQRAPVLQGSGLKKMLFGTFRTQQITMLNAYLDSAVRSHTLSAQLKTFKKGTAEYNSTAAKLKESKKRTAKINLAVALSGLLNASIRMGVTFIRHKDDEDERLSKFIWDFFDSYTSMFSTVGDIISWIAKHLHGESYYDTDIISFGAEGLVEDAFASFADIIDGEEDDTQDRVRDIINVAALFGVPARNAYNLIKAFLGWVEILVEKAGGEVDFNLDEW